MNGQSHCEVVFGPLVIGYRTDPQMCPNLCVRRNWNTWKILSAYFNSVSLDAHVNEKYIMHLSVNDKKRAKV